MDTHSVSHILRWRYQYRVWATKRMLSQYLVGRGKETLLKNSTSETDFAILYVVTGKSLTFVLDVEWSTVGPPLLADLNQRRTLLTFMQFARTARSICTLFRQAVVTNAITKTTLDRRSLFGRMWYRVTIRRYSVILSNKLLGYPIIAWVKATLLYPTAIATA